MNIASPAPAIAATGRAHAGLGDAPAVRPQSVMFSFLGDYVLDRGVSVYSGSVVDVFARVGVSEEATRSMLTRMAHRRLLSRQRQGRRIYFGLTPHSIEILRDGRSRVWQTGAVNETGSNSWTLIAFSLPDSWTRQRHDLRSRLVWAGFGPLRSGLWMAPGSVDVRKVLGELRLDDHVKVFEATPAPPTDMAQLVREAYDLDELAARYTDFLQRWSARDPVPNAPDPLARKLILMTEWLSIVRRDPRLPVNHLPEAWPAARAQSLFKKLHARYDPAAARIAKKILDVSEA